MLSANTEPPVPVIMGLLGTTLSSPLRLFDGLGLSNLSCLSRRQKASWRSEKFLSGRCWAVATAVKDSTVRMHNCDAVSVSCKLGSVCSTPFLPWRSTAGGNMLEGSIPFFSPVLLTWSWLAANPRGQQRDKACHTVLFSLGCCFVPSGISSRL